MLNGKPDEKVLRAIKSAELWQRILASALDDKGHDFSPAEMLDGAMTVILANKSAIEGPKAVASSLWLVAKMMNDAANDGHDSSKVH